MDYSDYTEEELMLDESFQNWVKGDNAVDISFWESWIAQHPHKRTLIENARNTLLQFQLSEELLSEEEITESWYQLQHALQAKKTGIHLSEQPGFAKSKLFKKRLGTRFMEYVAAVVSFIIIGCGIIYIIFFSSHANQIEKSTAFGETTIFSLPDGSQVVLNGNTSLAYNKTWSRHKTRQVWLEGEAYFSVIKQNNQGNERFVVHTPDLDIEVMGTQFNVSKRKDKTTVVLNEGKVKINTSAYKVPSVVMKPGELVEFSSKREALFKKNVNPEIYSSWKNKRLIFENTPMQEIAEMIESTYGLEVHFENEAQASRKLSGTLPTGNIDLLLLALSRTFNVNIEKNGNQIRVSAKAI